MIEEMNNNYCINKNVIGTDWKGNWVGTELFIKTTALDTAVEMTFSLTDFRLINQL